MTSVKTQLLIGLLIIAGNTSSALAQDESSFLYSGKLEYRNRNLFSGFPVSNGPVMKAIFEAGNDDLLLTAYTNYEFDTGELNEADVHGEYYFQPSDVVWLYIGAGNLNFKNFPDPGRWGTTYEFYTGFISTLPGNPELHYTRDFRLSDGGEALTLSMSHEIPAGSVTIIGSGNLTYNDKYYRYESNLSHYDLSLSVRKEFGDFTLIPKITFQKGLADDFDDFWVGTFTAQKDF